MKALVKEANNLSIKNWPKPSIKSSNDVLIRVMVAGICRTDIYIAKGQIKSKNPLVLGHEFSGVIEEIGSEVINLKIGDPVSVMPLISCGECSECKSDYPTNCLNSAMLGLDQDGAFAEFIVVNSKQVYALPEEVSFQLGAYLEPICAALAVLKADIKPFENGLIYGNNRIAILIKKILIAKGFQTISICEINNHNLKPNYYDFVIETVTTKEALEEIVKTVKPKGKIILKSRQYSPISLDLISIIKKEITLQAVNYALFTDTLKLATNKEINFSELFGKTYQLENFEEAFDESSSNDLLKRFFSLA
jgi:L-iditol 2-dehydrogenase